MADYTILIKAKLDLTEDGIKGVKTGLKTLTDKINSEKLFQLKPTLDLTGFDVEFNKIKEKLKEIQDAKKLAVNVGSPGISPGGGTTVNDAQLQADIARVKAMTVTGPKIETFVTPMGDINKIVETYTGNIGEAVVVTKKLVQVKGEENAEWIETVKYTNEAQASQKMLVVAGQEQLVMKQKEMGAIQAQALIENKQWDDRARMQERAAAENVAYDAKKIDALHTQALIENKQWDDRARMIEKASGENQIFDQKRIDNYNKINSQLDILKAKNADAFKTPQVQAELQNTLNVLNQFSQGKARVQDVGQAFNSLRAKVIETNNAIRTTHNSTDNWSTSLEKNIGKVIQWAIATGAVYTSLQKLREGIAFVTELNKVMTDTQIVSGASGEEIRKLSFEYNALAKELGSTTLEVGKASLEFVRQGKTAQETATLLRTSTMMSKLANLESAQATEYMTSTLNGFQLQAEDMMGVLDKLVALDNSYASSVGEISAAMQRSANSANVAGVSLTELASMITVISSVTRKSAESIGESLKTVFARMQSVTAGKDIDEFGESINDVEKTLGKFGIILRDSPTSFKPLGIVIDEIAGKWDNLTNVEKSQISTVVAGKYYARTYGDIWTIL